MNQLLNNVVSALAETKSTADLQDIIQALGIRGNLTELPDAKVLGEFQRLLADFLNKPIGELSIAEIRVLTGEVVKANKAHEPTLLAKDFASIVNYHTFTYRVAGPTIEQTQEAYIHGKLGNDAHTLIDRLEFIGVDVAVIAPKLNEVTLDTDSNNKNRSAQNKLYEGGLADPIQATNIAIEAVCAAKNLGLDLKSYSGESWESKGSRIKAEALKKGLDEGTATVLEKLTVGIIHIGGGSGSGALRVFDDGRLCARDCSGYGHPDVWAFGARPAPESKN